MDGKVKRPPPPSEADGSTTASCWPLLLHYTSRECGGEVKRSPLIRETGYDQILCFEWRDSYRGRAKLRSEETRWVSRRRWNSLFVVDRRSSWFFV